MKLFKKHLTLILAVFLLAVAILPVLPVVAADKGDFAAELKVGVDNKAEILRYAPFAITVENNGTDFSGKIQMILPNKVNYNLMYESDFSIAKGEKKTVTFSAKVLDNLGKVNIRIINKKGKVVWNEIKRFNVDKTASTKIDIGVLSDDFSALGYMDNIEFYDRETFKTNLVELTADDFPEDVNSLDMLEMIIISNFSTDILTDEQPAPVTVERIIAEVSNLYGVSSEDIRSKKRSQQVSNARKVAIFLVHEITTLTLAAIGEEFGNRDHSTIVYAVKYVQRNMKKDKNLCDAIESITKTIRDGTVK